MTISASRAFSFRIRKTGDLMRAFVRLLWDVISILKWTSLPVILGGVGLFGRNLVRVAAVNKDKPGDTLSPSIWRSDAARFSLKVFGIGIGLLVLSILLASLAPTTPA